MRSKMLSSVAETSRATVGASLLLLSILAAAPAAAVVDACTVNGQRVRQHGPSIEELNELAPPAAASVSDEELERLYRYPYPEAVDQAPLSFWDFVPGGFFVAIGRPRSEVEQIGFLEWQQLMGHFLSLRGYAREHRYDRRLTRSYLTIDWLYTMALVREEFSEAEFVRDGGIEGLEIPKALNWNAVRYTGREDMHQGLMWLMIAGLYTWEHLQFRPLDAELAEQFHVVDGYWHRFPKPSQPWNLTSEARRTREYLCSEPSVQYMTYRAELQAGSSEPITRRLAGYELRDLEAYVDQQVADFEAVAALLAPGSPHRARVLELVRNDGLRARLQHTLDTQGAAKSYVALRDKAIEAIQRRGDSNSVTSIWDALAPHEKYLWPDRCMGAFEFPSAMTADLRPDLLDAAQAFVCAKSSLSRDEIYDMYRPRP